MDIYELYRQLCKQSVTTVLNTMWKSGLLTYATIRFDELIDVDPLATYMDSESRCIRINLMQGLRETCHLLDDTIHVRTVFDGKLWRIDVPYTAVAHITAIENGTIHSNYSILGTVVTIPDTQGNARNIVSPRPEVKRPRLHIVK